jgi:glycosyltransferase involved in cell wall biosynthesis
MTNPGSALNVAMIQAFLPSRSNGGVGHLADQLANYLGRRGHHVTMFSMDPAPAESTYDAVNPPPGLRLTRGRLGLVYGFAAWIAGRDLSSFDVVHAMGDSHLLGSRPPVVRTLCGSALAEARHARRVRTALMYASIYPLELIAAWRASRTVTISDDTGRYYPGPHETIPPGVDLQHFHPDSTKADHPVILAVGHQVDDRKRLKLLLHAFSSSVLPARPDAELWLVCEETVVQPSVRSFRSLSTAELADLYRAAWVFCLPSSYEGFGRPYVEALASGTSVVATPNPGALEVLADGRYGEICAPADLGETLLGLLGDDCRRKRLADAGIERARAYDWNEVAMRYEGVYRSAIPAAAVRHAG